MSYIEGKKIFNPVNLLTKFIEFLIWLETSINILIVKEQEASWKLKPNPLKSKEVGIETFPEGNNS